MLPEPGIHRPQRMGGNSARTPQSLMQEPPQLACRPWRGQWNLISLEGVDSCLASADGSAEGSPLNVRIVAEMSRGL